MTRKKPPRIIFDCEGKYFKFINFSFSKSDNSRLALVADTYYTSLNISTSESGDIRISPRSIAFQDYPISSDAA